MVLLAVGVWKQYFVHETLLQEIAGDVQPHFTSIAAFVAKMHEQIEPLFTQVLMICDEEDLIGRNMFAIDGWHFILTKEVECK